MLARLARQMQGRALLAAVRAVREINRTATSGGCPNITAASQRVPRVNASNTNTLTHKSKQPNHQDARPPRRGSEPGDDAAQLRRDAAAAALPSSLNAAGDAAVGHRAGHPSGDANGKSEKGKAEAPEFGAEAPRSHPGEDVRAVAP